MITITLDDNSPEARAFVEYSKLLPFVQNVEEPEQESLEPEKLSFEEARAKNNTVSQDVFWDKAKQGLKEYYQGNA